MPLLQWPALSGVEGPALSDVEGPALSSVEGLASGGLPLNGGMSVASAPVGGLRSTVRRQAFGRHPATGIFPFHSAFPTLSYVEGCILQWVLRRHRRRSTVGGRSFNHLSSHPDAWLRHDALSVHTSLTPDT